MNLTGRDPDVPANLLASSSPRRRRNAGSLAAPEVALQVRLDDGDPVLLPQTISPDSDYCWLDRVTAEPVHLEPGGIPCATNTRARTRGLRGTIRPGTRQWTPPRSPPAGDMAWRGALRRPDLGGVRPDHDTLRTVKLPRRGGTAGRCPIAPLSTHRRGTSVMRPLISPLPSAEERPGVRFCSHHKEIYL